MKSRGLALGILSIAPLGLGAAVAGAMAASGDPRVLAIDLALPGAVLAAGAVASAVPAGILLARRMRRRSRRATDAAASTAASAAALHERESHRRFLARLDHELKNPLTAIRATAAAAQAENPTREWGVVDAQAMKLSALVRDLRKLAELETRPLQREPVDLEQMLAEAIAAIAHHDPAGASRMTLSTTRVPWPVPVMDVDLDLLSLAIDNVLGNAAKYSTDGPIEVRLREEHGWAVIDVADAGRGIPAADQPTVFDELARAGNARDVSGSGIGLTLVAAVIRHHGGDVQLRSVEGAGTVVTLRLPIEKGR